MTFGTEKCFLQIFFLLLLSVFVGVVPTTFVFLFQYRACTLHGGKGQEQRFVKCLFHTIPKKKKKTGRVPLLLKNSSEFLKKKVSRKKFIETGGGREAAIQNNKINLGYNFLE